MTPRAKSVNNLPVEDRAAEMNSGTTTRQLGALLSLAIVALWGLVALAVHLTSPGGMDRTELIFLLTLAPLYVLLLPLYWLRVRWAYPIGILALLGLLAGLAMEMMDRVYVFSWSTYNVGAIVALLAAAAGINLSIRAFRQRPRVGITKAALTLGGLLVLGAVIAIVASQNAETIRRVTAESTLDRMEARLDSLGNIDAQLAYLVDVGRYPSLVAGIVVGDSLVWSSSFGDADLETVYEIGSVTKPFVATAVLQLAEEGLLDLDEDINVYLPFEVRHPNYPDRPITTRMLLSHTSGLGHFTDQYHAYHYGDEQLAWLADKHGEKFPSIDPRPGFAEFLPGYLTIGGQYYRPEAWRSSMPGNEYGYSTVGYDLAAYLVGQISGMTFEDYLQTRVLDPLSMSSTGTSVQDFPDRQALPFWRLSGVLSQTNQALPLSDSTTTGGGGMVSTVPDLARFVGAQLNEGTLQTGQLLRPETVDLMQARSVSFSKGAGDINQIGYGLGLGHVDTQPWQYWGHGYDMRGAVGHGGSTGASTAQIWFVDKPDGGYGIVLATNVDRAKPDYFDVWFFSTLYRMQTLLVDEAETRYETLNG